MTPKPDTDTSKDAGPPTVFAPTDASFAKVPADKLDMMMNDKARCCRAS